MFTLAAILVATVVPTTSSDSPPLQELAGFVAEQGTLHPAADAVVTLFRVEAGSEDLLPAATTTTDDDGAFRFILPAPGTYRVQADLDGLSSPLSQTIALSTSDRFDDLVLLVPSPLLMLAASCELESAPGAVVVGTVRDEVSAVPLPGVRVEARWSSEGVGLRRALRGSAETNARGHFLLCGVGVGGTVGLRAAALGREGEWAEIEIPRPAIVFHDVELPLGTATSPLNDELLAELFVTARDRVMGDLRGRLVDQATGEPIAQAVVRLRGTSLQAVTDAEGRFLFPDVQPGEYTIEIQHLGYSVQTSEIELPEGSDVMLELRVSPRAVQLEGIEVVARSRLETDIRTSPFRRQVVAGERIAAAELRGGDITNLLRAEFTGLNVREIYTQRGPILCVFTNRRVQSVDPTQPECPMVRVVVDGIRVDAGVDGSVLRTFPLNEIESIEYLTPVQATTLFGSQGAALGVLVIHTRGKGPYVSEARNR